MSVKIPNNMRFYRYKVESLDVLFPTKGKTKKVESGLVNGIYIEKDYENDYFPVIRLDLSLTTELYHEIIENKLDVKFRLRFQKLVVDENDKVLFKKDVFNSIFTAFIDESTPFLSKKEYEEAKKATVLDEKGQHNAALSGNDVTFYLFNESDLLNSKKIISTVITSANMTQTLAYLLSSSGINKVLMVPLDNSSSYSQIIIPPLTTLGNLIYLDNQYGFYKTGSLIFFDTDCLYILDRSWQCKAFRKGEYKKTFLHIKSTINENSLISGSHEDKEKKTVYVNVDPRSFRINDASILKDQLEGNNLMIIHPSKGNTSKINTSAIQRGKGTYKVLYNKYNNQFKNSAEKTIIESERKIVTANISDFDVDAFTPNKEFSISYEDPELNKKISGMFRLVDTKYVFEKNGEEFKIHGIITLKK